MYNVNVPPLFQVSLHSDIVSFRFASVRCCSKIVSLFGWFHLWLIDNLEVVKLGSYCIIFGCLPRMGFIRNTLLYSRALSPVIYLTVATLVIGSSFYLCSNPSSYSNSHYYHFPHFSSSSQLGSNPPPHLHLHNPPA